MSSPQPSPARRLADPIFVVGCPRSGTTLVQCILSASSGAFSLPETHFFSMVLPALGVAPSAPLSAEPLRRARAELPKDTGLELDDAAWSGLERQHATALDLFLALAERYRPAEDASTRRLRLVEKTPLHVLHLEQIGALFPDARFVNVVRDPVDVASSWLGVPFASTRSVLSHARAWVEAVTAAQRYAERHPGRLRTITHERLTSELEPTVRALCDFLRLPFEARMLQEFGREAARNVGRGETWKEDVQRGVLLRREGVWRQRISPGQARLIARATGGLAAEFGYTDGSNASAGSVLAAVWGESLTRFREGRRAGSLWGSLRHAGATLKALRPARGAAA